MSDAENERAIAARNAKDLSRAKAPSRPTRVTRATFNWHTKERPRHARSLQRLCELIAMSKQPGGMKRAIARMQCGDAVVELRRWAVG